MRTYPTNFISEVCKAKRDQDEGRIFKYGREMDLQRSLRDHKKSF